MAANEVSNPGSAKTANLSVDSFPKFPGEDFLAHEGALFKEQAEARLAAKKLLAVAQGYDPPSVTCIVDVDLTSLPALPPGDRDHHRREEARIKIQAQNKANDQKRHTLRMEAWTELYTLLKASTELTAPVLSRDLMRLCDLWITRKLPGGYFDGPRAWNIVLHKLEGDHRSETDKDYYRSAERIQRASHLPDGCKATEYSRKALAFLIHIKPFLSQSYDDDDTTQYLIGLMPKALREGGRRIKDKLVAEGRQHDFIYVIQTCRSLVHEEQKAAPPSPAFMLAEEDAFRHEIDDLQRTTGMFLASPSHPGRNDDDRPTVPGFAAGPGRWCKDCPHKGMCFADPSYAGPPPINVYLNKERWSGILQAKAANAKKAGVPDVPGSCGR